MEKEDKSFVDRARERESEREGGKGTERRAD